MNHQFIQHLESLGVTKSQRTLLAVSGGLDSMVMLHLFVTHQYPVAVAHANFQLRGTDSIEDEVFVQTHCHQHQIPFYSKRFETNNYATAHKVSIQMAARELRYAWFDELLLTGFTYLATAHHLNDSLETVLLSLTRGAGVEAMAGILPKSGPRIRPLLFATRQKLERYAGEHSIPWREDSSNKTDDYARNFIRHRVVPVLKQVNPSLEATFQETLHKTRQELEILNRDFSGWRNQFLLVEGDIIKIRKSGLDAGTGIARLWYVLRPYGFTYTQCSNAMESVTGQSGKFFVSETHQLTLDREYLLLTRLTPAWEPVPIHESLAEATNGSLKLFITHNVPAQPGHSEDRVVVDASKIRFPLVWRKWKAGDSFIPLGLSGRKKVSDFLVDSKVPVAMKESVTVLESGGEVVWLVGRRLDDRFKLTPATTRAIEFSVSPQL